MAALIIFIAAEFQHKWKETTEKDSFIFNGPLRGQHIITKCSLSMDCTT